jgi:hypothetical protein
MLMKRQEKEKQIINFTFLYGTLFVTVHKHKPKHPVGEEATKMTQ